MSEVEIQQPECGKCGVKVRPNTDFCYNCGAPVTAKAALPVANGAGPVLDETPAGNYENFASKPETGDVIRDTETGNTNGVSAHLEDRRPPPARYESAAGLRRKSKTAARKPVEVTWEPEAESLNVKFVIASICLAIFVTILVAVALYLR